MRKLFAIAALCLASLALMPAAYAYTGPEMFSLNPSNIEAADHAFERERMIAPELSFLSPAFHELDTAPDISGPKSKFILSNGHSPSFRTLHIDPGRCAVPT